MSVFVMSDEYSYITEAIKSYGNTIIESDSILCFNKPEQRHIDMQMLKIDNDIFILKEAKTLYGKISKLPYNIHLTETDTIGKYPYCTKLNALYLNNKLFCREKSLDIKVRQYCKNNNIEIVNVNQGYTACSTAVISDKAAITADMTIYKSLNQNDIDVLLISAGNITLEGYNYGFIGGACTMIDSTNLCFFGDITLHPDYEIIQKFCIIHDVNIISNLQGIPLVDIGGAIKL